MLTLTEQGLYFFMGRSDKPKALPFQKWVYGDVLSSIRKTGSYTTRLEILESFLWASTGRRRRSSHFPPTG